MTFTTAHMSVSLDGFSAGPDQSFEQPLGRNGIEVHRWHVDPDHQGPVDKEWTARLLRPRGAYVMGRNMYGPVRGDWSTWTDDDGKPTLWSGWWGEEPPYHAPVFVLTHYAREPIEMQGTTFFFVTDGFEAALKQAREAGDGDVDIAGGASAVRQAIAADELDELTLDITPVLLGSGERIFDGSITPELEVVEAEHSPLTTHVRYRIKH